MAAKLALSTTAPRKRRAPSSAQIAQRQAYQRLGQTWRSLSFDEKATWVAASRQINGAHPNSTTKTARVTAYSTFVQAGTSLYPTTGTVPRTATLPPVFPAPFGSLLLAAEAPFRLVITGQTYPHHVLIRAAAPVPAGQTTYPKGAFKIIGTLPSLTGSDDITALYTAHFLAPGPGASIAVELIGVSAGGLRTAPTVLSVLTSGTDLALVLD